MCNHVRGAVRRLLLDKKDILSLGVHFTADKKRRPPAHSCRWACNEGSIHLKFLIHPAFVKGRNFKMLVMAVQTFSSAPATQPGSDARDTDFPSRYILPVPGIILSVNSNKVVVSVTDDTVALLCQTVSVQTDIMMTAACYYISLFF